MHFAEIPQLDDCSIEGRFNFELLTTSNQELFFIDKWQIIKLPVAATHAFDWLLRTYLQRNGKKKSQYVLSDFPRWKSCTENKYLYF